MKKYQLSLFVVILFVSGVFSQKTADVEKQVGDIRAVYTDLSREIAEIEADPEKAQYSSLAVNELVVNKLNRSWAAVGNYKVVFRFYYQNRAEALFFYPNELVKVTKTTESAARRYLEEFVYDESGALIFYFEKSEDDEAPEELRLYFAQGKAIRIIEDKEKRDKLTVEDNKTAKNVLKKGAHVRDLFVKSIAD